VVLDDRFRSESPVVRFVGLHCQVLRRCSLVQTETAWIIIIIIIIIILILIG